MNELSLSFYEFLGAVTFFGVIYTYLDAWHDKKVINKDKKTFAGVKIDWHFADAVVKGFVMITLVVTAIVNLEFTMSWLLALLSITYLVLIRANMFDTILNKLRQLKASHRGKNFTDQIHWSIKLILFVVNLVGIILIFEFS